MIVFYGVLFGVPIAGALLTAWAFPGPFDAAWARFVLAVAWIAIGACAGVQAVLLLPVLEVLPEGVAPRLRRMRVRLVAGVLAVVIGVVAIVAARLLGLS